eukprot:TRINITY_DN4098_c0_g1_i1.p3 TRINITY_DN4098_c0_g1~~TRINITY_DN4098_c0_g1_i1.p3  ORF type:complete len:135 (-),score=39.88 TRINITY_DN4098_c0_g1_i1:104-484(-)
MTTPLLAGLGVAAAATAARLVVRALARRTAAQAGEGAAAAGGRKFALPEFKFKMPGLDTSKAGFEAQMSRREAAKILGLRESATPAQIKTAYMKIMNNNHPDRGGSSFLASKINEAKDKMLGGRAA